MRRASPITADRFSTLVHRRRNRIIPNKIHPSHPTQPPAFYLIYLACRAENQNTRHGSCLSLALRVTC